MIKPERLQQNGSKELSQGAEAELVKLALEFISQFPENYEDWFGEEGNYFYLKVAGRPQADEVSITAMNLKEKKIPASSSHHPLGDYDNPSLMYKLNLVLRKDALYYLELTGEPLPKTALAEIRLAVSRLAMSIKIGLLSQVGRINTKIVTFPLREDSIRGFTEITPKVKDIMQTFGKLVQESH